VDTGPSRATRPTTPVGLRLVPAIRAWWGGPLALPSAMGPELAVQRSSRRRAAERLLRQHDGAKAPQDGVGYVKALSSETMPQPNPTNWPDVVSTRNISGMPKKENCINWMPSAWKVSTAGNSASSRFQEAVVVMLPHITAGVGCVN
jgi:hypothetical protein